jgi:hypothetical protein
LSDFGLLLMAHIFLALWTGIVAYGFDINIE